MLVLSRKAGESVVIGDNIVVNVSRISRNRVTVAIDAPKDVPIKRGELVSPSTPRASSGTSDSASLHVAAYPG